MTDLLYGRNAIREALRAERRRIYKLMIAKGVKETGPVAEILTAARQRRIPWQYAERRQLDKASGEQHHQGRSTIVAEKTPQARRHPAR